MSAPDWNAVPMTPELRAQLALIEQAQPEPKTTQEKAQALAAQGIVEGALVVDPHDRLARVLHVGLSTKPTSSGRRRTKRDFYVTVRRFNSSGRPYVSRIAFEGARTLKAIAPPADA